MTTKPTVSIVTPSYNQGQYLEQTILSVLKQDYPNIEYIIIDGGSNDQSVEIIQKYENRINYWHSEPDQGQADALIKGFTIAKGSLFCWLCSDDILEPSMVSMSVYNHLKYPEIGLTYGDRIRIDSKGNIYDFQRYPEYRTWFISLGLTLPQETTMFRKDVYEAVGGINKTLEMAMDFDLWCRIVKRYKVKHIPAYLGRFRTHMSNKSSIFSEQKKANQFLSDYPKEYAETYAKYFNRTPSTLLIRIGKFLRSTLAFYERRKFSYRRETKELREIGSS